MAAIKVNIVGLKYRDIDITYLDRLEAASIRLEREPSNPHDPFAVKCLSNGKHFGYVEKEKSQLITGLLLVNPSFSAKKLSQDKYKLVVELDFPRGHNLHQSNPDLSGIESLPGIYAVDFVHEKSTYTYVGQSTDVLNRLQQHLRQLNSCSHSNKLMQMAWSLEANSFRFRMIEKVPRHLSPIERQIFLFERENHWISSCVTNSANRIGGDFVLSSDSSEELIIIKDTISDVIKSQKQLRLFQKEKLGCLVLDLGIIRGSRGAVKKTNVLTWMNKRRYGIMEYAPIIDREHVLYGDLHEALTKIQQILKVLEAEFRLVNEFPKVDIGRQGGRFRRDEFERTQRERINQFAGILNKYKQFPASAIKVNNSSMTSKGAIKYDMSLNELLSESAKRILNDGLHEPKFKPEQPNYRVSVPSKKWWKLF